MAEHTRAQWLARFLNSYWGESKSPESLAAKIRKDLDLEERVDADELWVYVAFVAANASLESGFAQGDVNEFFKIAAMDRGGNTGYDRLLGLIEKRLPQYVQVSQKAALLQRAEAGEFVLAAMKEPAENVAGYSGASLRIVLLSITSDIGEKMKRLQGSH